MNLVQICLHRSVIIQKRAITQCAYNLFFYFVGYCFYVFTDHNDTDSVGACLSVMFLVQHVWCNVFGVTWLVQAYSLKRVLVHIYYGVGTQLYSYK